MLWPDAPPDAARKRLAQALSWLWRHLKPGSEAAAETNLETDRHRIRLNPQIISTDVHAFEEHLSLAVRSFASPDPVRLYEAAVEIYVGTT